MTDIHTRDEHQVVDLTAARAAKGLITAEMFNAAGVPIVERPPSNPTRKDDLVPNQVTSDFEVLRQGAEAMNRLSSNHSRDWGDWLKVLAALGIGRHTAMLEASANEPRGYKYCAAFARWLRCHEAFQAIDQADRKRMFDCWDNLSAIEEWRAGLSPVQLSKWNYPPTVLREWKRSQRPSADTSPPPPPPPSPAPLLAPEELRRQLEILGLSRFRQEVMPPDWRTPLADTMLALATTEQLIAMLERKHSPSKAASTALKSLRKSQPPNP